MTEDEAKTKWCHNAGNQTRCVSQDGFCTGSSCMAWRWMIFNKNGAVMLMQSRLHAKKDADEDWSIGGYCGLAGKP